MLFLPPKFTKLGVDMAIAFDVRRGGEKVNKNLDALVDTGVIDSKLVSDKSDKKAMLVLLKDWKHKFRSNSKTYFNFAAQSLKKICKNPQDFINAANILLEKLHAVFGNGSHQFIAEAIPSLVEKGLVTNTQQLEFWSRALVSVAKEKRRGEHLFTKIAKKIKDGSITSVEDLQKVSLA